MMILHAHVWVKPECVEAFLKATKANARESAKEPGIAVFDVLQLQDDPGRFVLVEIYRAPEAQLAHRETKHYQIWRDTVAPMMAQPRQALKYAKVFPLDQAV